jgi:manganese transport protein
VMFTCDKIKMGEFVNPRWVKILGWTLAMIIALLNGYLLWQTLTGSMPA